jgi:glycosyltransferase involved in cell wall biosynthesis
MLPTFKRPEKLKIFLDSAAECANKLSDICILLCVNENDAITENFIAEYEFPFDFAVIRENTTQPNLALYYNLMYDSPLFRKSETVVSMIGDDMIFKTKGYDTAILKAINDANGEALVYCDDDFIAHDKLMVQVFTTRKVVDATLKPFMCPLYHADMIDVVWINVGLLTGILKYLPDVKIKHAHESVKSKVADMDETCQRMMPLRRLANEKQSREYGWRYAHLCAANLIDAGIGKWNVL